jgi:hypothetical protein
MVTWQFLNRPLSRRHRSGHTAATAAATASALLATLLAVAPAARAQGGWYHINHSTAINFGIPADNLAIGESNIDPFTVFLNPGFSVDVDMAVSNRATVYLTAGSVGQTLRTARDTFWNPTIFMSGGTVGGHVALDSFWRTSYADKPQASRFFMSDGSVGGLYSYGTHSFISLSGGIVSGPVEAHGPQSVTKISGGTISQWVHILGGSADITGGSAGLWLRASNEAHVKWKGGTFNWNLAWAENDAIISIYGTGLSLVETGRGMTISGDGTKQVPYVDYRLNGTLEDGTPLVNRYVTTHSNGKIRIIDSLARPNLRVSAASAFVLNHNEPSAQTTAYFTLQNAGNGTARNIVIDSITIGTQTRTGLNWNVADIEPGDTADISRTISADYAGQLPATITLSIQGRFDGGTFNISRRATVTGSAAQ